MFENMEQKKSNLIFSNYKLVDGKINGEREVLIEEEFEEDLIFMSPAGDFYKVFCKVNFDKELKFFDDFDKETIIYLYNYSPYQFAKLSL